MLVVEQHEGGSSDGADASGAKSDPAQRLEGGLEQRVAAFGRGPGGRVQQVRGALVGGQPAGSVGPGGWAWDVAAVGADQGAVHGDVPVSAARAASSAPRNPGAAAARASMPSCRYR